MRRLLTVLCACCVLVAVSAPNAAAKKCPSTSDYELIKVFGGVTCAKGQKVVTAYFDDPESTPFGFTCKQKQYEGGATTTCRKGAKKVKHFSAD